MHKSRKKKELIHIFQIKRLSTLMHQASISKMQARRLMNQKISSISQLLYYRASYDFFLIFFMYKRESEFVFFSDW
jgi:hypothetical protein